MINRKILLVDDEERLLASLGRNLRNFADLHLLSKPEEVIGYMKENGPFAVIVSDYKMPNMNGIELLEAVQKTYPDTVRMILTGQADLDVSINSINKGNIFRFLTKPCNIEMLKNQIKDAVRQYELIIAEKELLRDTLQGSLKVITDILSMLNPDSFGKSNQAKDYVKKMQESLEMKNFWQMELASSLYLIGFSLLPVQVVQKQKAAEMLSPAEQEMFDCFPELSAKIISNIPRLEGVTEIISNINYKELSKDLPIESRVLRVVDDYLTLTNRVNPLEAVDVLKSMTATYDAKIVNVLASVVAYKGDFRRFNRMISEIKEGMILDEDVMTPEGLLLVKKGHVLNDASITRLYNYSRTCGVIEPVRVLVVKEQGTYAENTHK